MIAATIVAAQFAIAADQHADDVFYSPWFYDILSVLKEPDLRNPAANSKAEIYRMVGASRGKLPATVRIEVQADGHAIGTLRSIDLSATSEWQFGYERKFDVRPDDVDALRTAFVNAKFWQMPVYQGGYDEHGKLIVVPICGDGTSVLIEAQSNGKYRGVNRNCGGEMFESAEPLIEQFKRLARPHVSRLPHQFIE
ncbi:MAG: hypothetical protein GC190_05365 [Alphaproteobacteria bacterium]|nr:hypothetical protein [Alphaproteobacteria bacterium]